MGAAVADLAEEGKQFADLVALLGWVAHLGFLVDQVAVAPAVSLAFEESRFGEVGHDPLGSSFGDSDCLGDVSEPDVGIVGDVKAAPGRGSSKVQMRSRSLDIDDIVILYSVSRFSFLVSLVTR